jgi:sarcosine oxidase delta subunit
MPQNMKLAEDMRVDAQSIGIIKDKETAQFVDYFFIANLWCKDPRYESRHMQAGECRGFFRFDKATLSAELLFPMAGDESEKRFEKAAWKVLSEFRATAEWPKGTQFASG